MGKVILEEPYKPRCDDQPEVMYGPFFYAWFCLPRTVGGEAARSQSRFLCLLDSGADMTFVRPGFVEKVTEETDHGVPITKRIRVTTPDGPIEQDRYLGELLLESGATLILHHGFTHLDLVAQIGVDIILGRATLNENQLKVTLDGKRRVLTIEDPDP